MSAQAVPRTREFLADGLTPIGVYRRLQSASPIAFLFESVTGGAQVSRYSFLGSGPTVSYELDGSRMLERRGGEAAVSESHGPIAEQLRSITTKPKSPAGEFPFMGGWVGTFGYSLVAGLEPVPQSNPDPFGTSTVWLGRFDNLVVFDHAQQRVVAIANEIEGEVSRQQAEAALDFLSQLLVRPGGTGAVALPADGPRGELGARPSIPGPEFRQAVEIAREYIRAGDIFQVVLARRFELDQQVSPLALYRALRRVNPSPYMVLLETDQAALIGASPEMLVRKTGRRVQARPIAGTRRRGRNEAEDRELATELLADPKERAEHVMLVDLGRNDLGRIASAGSVELATFMEVELYSHVMHIVSSVECELAEGLTALDALFACFPACTVSGAPKIRAMQIIDELEPEQRGPYAGAVGYLSFADDLDTCITIRTLVVRDGKVSVTAGAGIVADSDPASEERETENKAAALLAAIEVARSLEALSLESGATITSDAARKSPNGGPKEDPTGAPSEATKGTETP